MSDERFLKVISRRKWKVLDRPPVRGPRRAIVSVGDPINVLDFHAEYTKDKKRTVLQLTECLEARVGAELERLVTGVNRA